MEVTADVINDLLPAYLAGEASPDTVRLVDEYLAAHPDVARVLRSGPIEQLLNERVTLQADAEKQALDRVKGLIRRQTWFMALGILFTLIPFSLRIAPGHVTFFVLQETPVLAIVYWLAAAAFWVGWMRTRRLL